MESWDHGANVGEDGETLSGLSPVTADRLPLSVASFWQAQGPVQEHGRQKASRKPNDPKGHQTPIYPMPGLPPKLNILITYINCSYNISLYAQQI